MRRAQVRLALADPLAARADLDRALAIDPSDDEIRRLRAWLRVNDGDTSGARDDLEQCLSGRCAGGSAGANDALRWAQRGLALHAQMGNFEQALSDLDEAFIRARVPADRIELGLAAAAVALRAGAPEAAEQWLARMPNGPTLPWQDDLARVARGTLPPSELAARATIPDRWCELPLAAAVRAELAGNARLALQQYRAGARTPWFEEPACLAADACARSLAAELPER
jgi:tetratricopeptide (TPR) repeat protein